MLHQPVLLERSLALLSPALTKNNALVVDATLGAGGHSFELLTHFPNIHLIGIDRDLTAIDHAKTRLAKFDGRITLIHAIYDQMQQVIAAAGYSGVDGILFDLGVSSMQLDEPERGFSYAQNAPLDMRMDSTDGITAAEVINTFGGKELARIFREYGEERFASRIADRIIKEREVELFTNSSRLAEVIRESIPAATRRTGGHPAKRTFQALRIFINDEISILERAIPAALNILNQNGRMVVLSYHSLEDRIVKRAFTAVSTSSVPHGLPIEPTPADYRLLTRQSESASDVEISENPRATSVRLRAIEKVGGVAA
ncbi:unannotated protein [freshwater metagenome]|uniref:Unannotated protein n=1 Tax=freshwater metagenome TaxID=449393 RepID=A0A6J6QVS8_9ZZZZ